MNAVLQGFVAAGAGPKKTHPSCPLCKRDYAAIRRPAVPLASNSAAAVSAAIAAMAAGPGSFESLPIQSILPPPSQFLAVAFDGFSDQAQCRHLPSRWPTSCPLTRRFPAKASPAPDAAADAVGTDFDPERGWP